MDRNYEWFLKADLQSYQGQYVVISHEKIVASGDDPGEIFEKAKREYPNEEVILWKVPVGEAFVFIILNAH